jgi:hypothetical protein
MKMTKKTCHVCVGVNFHRDDGRDVLIVLHVVHDSMDWVDSFDLVDWVTCASDWDVFLLCCHRESEIDWDYCDGDSLHDRFHVGYDGDIDRGDWDNLEQDVVFGSFVGDRNSGWSIEDDNHRDDDFGNFVG